MSVVLDASALLAYLQLEPGADADHEHRPRQVLDWMTPHEVYYGVIA